MIFTTSLTAALMASVIVFPSTKFVMPTPTTTIFVKRPIVRADLPSPAPIGSTFAVTVEKPSTFPKSDSAIMRPTKTFVSNNSISWCGSTNHIIRSTPLLVPYSSLVMIDTMAECSSKPYSTSISTTAPLSYKDVDVAIMVVLHHDHANDVAKPNDHKDVHVTRFQHPNVHSDISTHAPVVSTFTPVVEKPSIFPTNSHAATDSSKNGLSSMTVSNIIDFGSTSHVVGSSLLVFQYFMSRCIFNTASEFSSKTFHQKIPALSTTTAPVLHQDMDVVVVIYRGHANSDQFNWFTPNNVESTSHVVGSSSLVLQYIMSRCIFNTVSEFSSKTFHQKIAALSTTTAPVLHQDMDVVVVIYRGHANSDQFNWITPNNVESTSHVVGSCSLVFQYSMSRCNYNTAWEFSSKTFHQKIPALSTTTAPALHQDMDVVVVIYRGHANSDQFNWITPNNVDKAFAVAPVDLTQTNHNNNNIIVALFFLNHDSLKATTPNKDKSPTVAQTSNHGGFDSMSSAYWYKIYDNVHPIVVIFSNSFKTEASLQSNTGLMSRVDMDANVFNQEQPSDNVFLATAYDHSTTAAAAPSGYDDTMNNKAIYFDANMVKVSYGSLNIEFSSFGASAPLSHDHYKEAPAARNQEAPDVNTHGTIPNCATVTAVLLSSPGQARDAMSVQHRHAWFDSPAKHCGMKRFMFCLTGGAMTRWLWIVAIVVAYSIFHVLNSKIGTSGQAKSIRIHRKQVAKKAASTESITHAPSMVTPLVAEMKRLFIPSAAAAIADVINQFEATNMTSPLATNRSNSTTSADSQDTVVKSDVANIKKQALSVSAPTSLACTPRQLRHPTKAIFDKSILAPPMTSTTTANAIHHPATRRRPSIRVTTPAPTVVPASQAVCRPTYCEVVKRNLQPSPQSPTRSALVTPRTSNRWPKYPNSVTSIPCAESSRTTAYAMQRPAPRSSSIRNTTPAPNVVSASQTVCRPTYCEVVKRNLQPSPQQPTHSALVTPMTSNPSPECPDSVTSIPCGVPVVQRGNKNQAAPTPLESCRLTSTVVDSEGQLIAKSSTTPEAATVAATPINTATKSRSASSKANATNPTNGHISASGKNQLLPVTSSTCKASKAVVPKSPVRLLMKSATKTKATLRRTEPNTRIRNTATALTKQPSTPSICKPTYCEVAKRNLPPDPQEQSHRSSASPADCKLRSLSFPKVLEAAPGASTDSCTTTTTCFAIKPPSEQQPHRLPAESRNKKTCDLSRSDYVTQNHTDAAVVLYRKHAMSFVTVAANKDNSADVQEPTKCDNKHVTNVSAVRQFRAWFNSANRNSRLNVASIVFAVVYTIVGLFLIVSISASLMAILYDHFWQSYGIPLIEGMYNQHGGTNPTTSTHLVAPPSSASISSTSNHPSKPAITQSTYSQSMTASTSNAVVEKTASPTTMSAPPSIPNKPTYCDIAKQYLPPNPPKVRNYCAHKLLLGPQSTARSVADGNKTHRRPLAICKPNTLPNCALEVSDRRAVGTSQRLPTSATPTSMTTKRMSTTTQPLRVSPGANEQPKKSCNRNVAFDIGITSRPNTNDLAMVHPKQEVTGKLPNKDDTAGDVKTFDCDTSVQRFQAQLDSAKRWSRAKLTLFLSSIIYIFIGWFSIVAACAEIFWQSYCDPNVKRICNQYKDSNNETIAQSAKLPVASPSNFISSPTRHPNEDAFSQQPSTKSKSASSSGSISERVASSTTTVAVPTPSIRKPTYCEVAKQYLPPNPPKVQNDRTRALLLGPQTAPAPSRVVNRNKLLQRPLAPQERDSPSISKGMVDSR